MVEKERHIRSDSYHWNNEKNKLYRCDPDENNICTKVGCYRKYGPCRLTRFKVFKMNRFKRIKEWFKYAKINL